MAKVSIIIPTYNVEMYLVECMESIIHQTLKDIEIILYQRWFYRWFFGNFKKLCAKR